MTTTETTKGFGVGFIGIQYLAEKFNCCSEKILALFIDSDYSISRTAEYLENMEAA
jgi:hypothetical protein